MICGNAIGRWNGVDDDDEVDVDIDVNAGGGPEGKLNGDSAVGPCGGKAEYAGRLAWLPSWASRAALLASISFPDIVFFLWW